MDELTLQAIRDRRDKRKGIDAGNGKSGISLRNGWWCINPVAGAVGTAGAPGIAGPDGANGAQGFQGLRGASGSTGPQGIQGSAGLPGLTGARGVTGVDGDNSADEAIKRKLRDFRARVKNLQHNISGQIAMRSYGRSYYGYRG